MVKEWRYAGVACLMVSLAACSGQPAKTAKSVVPAESMVIDVPDANADADRKQVVDAVAAIRAGTIQASIDGPLTDVVNRFEKRYANTIDMMFSARGPGQAIIYMLAASTSGRMIKEPGSRYVAVGPAWAMAYWGRGYGYSEMGRYSEAEIELKKALALAPADAVYMGELGYVYQMQKRWGESLAAYSTMIHVIDGMDGWTVADKTEFACKAYRGQGFNLTELHRYDEAEVAYKACMALIPDEPKSKGELGYIQGLRAKVK